MPPKDSNEYKLLRQSLDYLKEKVDSIDHKLEKNYITKEEVKLIIHQIRTEYDPTRKTVNQLRNLIVGAFFAALAALLYNKPL